MELISTAWHAFSAALVLFCGGCIAAGLSRYFNITIKRSLFLYLWHTCFCVLYALYVIEDGGDALGYYFSSLDIARSFGPGTSGVIYLTSIFSDHLGFSFLGTFLVFNIFGSIGLLAFYACLQAATLYKSINIRRLVLLVVLLPSVSFWSSAIGKDALSFMAMGLSLWAALELRRRYWLMAIAVLVMLLVRPHMAGMMLIGLSAAFVIHGDISLLQRLIFGSAALVATTIMVPFALKYAGVGEGADVDALMSYVETRQGYNQGGGGGIDISAMSPPLQFFTYMFRPLPFEAGSVFQLAASLDNMIMLFLFLAGGMAKFKGRRSPLMENRTFLWVYALLSWLALSMTTANLGISVRQKWMFAPVLIFLLISTMGNNRVSAHAVNEPLTIRHTYSRDY